MKTLFVFIVLLIGLIVPLVIVVVHAKLFAKQRIEFVTDWKTFFKRWSTWLNATALGFGVWFNTSPQLMVDMWHQLPDEWKASIPQRYVEMMPFAFVVASTIVTNIRQQRLAHVPTGAGVVEPLPTANGAGVGDSDRPHREFIGDRR